MTFRHSMYLLAVAGLGLFLWGAWIPIKAIAAQVLLDHAWSRVQAGEMHARPWPWGDTHPIAWVSVPRLSESAIVLAGGAGRTLAFGPGHLDGTAQPGAKGHSIIGAHRDTHFSFLKDVVKGDRILVERPNGLVTTYRIVDMEIVDTGRQDILHFPDTDLLTMITCYPFEDWVPGAPLRYVVTAEAVI